MFALFLIAALAQSQQSDPHLDAFGGIPNIRIEYYDVAGSSLQQIHAEMQRLGPTDMNDSKRVQALTRWKVRWSWKGNGKGGCDLSSARTDFDAVITLPRLDPAKLKAKDRQRWERFMKGLVAHEAIHARNGYDASQQITSAIAGATCDTASATGQTILKAAKQRDVDFDVRTKHGASDGVTL